MPKQTPIPCILMRGGTSKGPYFRMQDIPQDPEERARILLAAMGSPDVRQIDGIGGADTLTSKVAMVGPSEREGVDVDYLFAQVSVDQAIVDTSPSCGNMLSGVGPFAIESGMVPITGDLTSVVIYDINTKSRIEAIVQTPDGAVNYEGDAQIDGVPGTAAEIRLNFMDIVGSKTGALLPTGHAVEEIDGVKVTLIDVAVPMMIFRAADLARPATKQPRSWTPTRHCSAGWRPCAWRPDDAWDWATSPARWFRRWQCSQNHARAAPLRPVISFPTRHMPPLR
jgi:Uncharacterized protein conserved in bacteria